MLGIRGVDNKDRFDKNGCYKVFKGVELPRKERKVVIPKLGVGESLKADSQAEASRLYSILHNKGFKIRTYKTGQGFWWVQRIK